MKVKILFFALLTISVVIQAQTLNKRNIRLVIKGVNKSESQKIISDSIISSIQKNNDLVIGYAVFNTSWMHTPVKYFLFGFRKRTCTAYKYTVKQTAVNGEQAFELERFNVPNIYADSALDMSRINKVWAINSSENDTADYFCDHITGIKPCMISDAHYMRLIVTTKKRQRVSSFYAPEYFEYQCCPGNINRKRFLSFILPIRNYFDSKDGTQ